MLVDLRVSQLYRQGTSYIMHDQQSSWQLMITALDRIMRASKEPAGSWFGVLSTTPSSPSPVSPCLKQTESGDVCARCSKKWCAKRVAAVMLLVSAQKKVAVFCSIQYENTGVYTEARCTDLTSAAGRQPESAPRASLNLFVLSLVVTEVALCSHCTKASA